MKKILGYIKKSSSKKTILLLILILIIISLYFIINFIIKKLNIPEFDFTSSKLYSITKKSEEKIKQINKKIQIKLVNFENYLYSADISDTVNFINKYSQVNSNITIEKTKDDSVAEPTIIITSENNSKTISFNDIFSYNFSAQTYTYEYYDKTEEIITNAILEVANKNHSKVYFYITKSIYTESYLTTIIDNANKTGNDVAYLDMTTTKKIPEDCTCLVIPQLVNDISENEKNQIINYINNGGNILLLQESPAILNLQIQNLEFSNFKYITDLYGFEIGSGAVMEQSDEKMINDTPGFISAIVNNENSVNKNLDKNLRLYLIDSGKINFKDEETLKKLNVTYEVLVSASDSAFFRTDLSITDSTKTESDENATNAILATMINKKIDDEKSSKLIVYANSIFATDSQIYIIDPITEEYSIIKSAFLDDNELILKNSINYLSENDNSVIIRKKYYDNISTIKMIKDNTMFQALYIIPLLILLIGFIVWRIRKNKK